MKKEVFYKNNNKYQTENVNQKDKNLSNVFRKI